jgi:hypothetical protein
LNSDNILIAANALAWEHGMLFDTDHCESDGDVALSSVDLYAGAAFRTPRHMFLEAAARQGVPVLAGVQFPLAEWLRPATLLSTEAAFDPRIFAAHLGDEVARWR